MGQAHCQPCNRRDTNQEEVVLVEDPNFTGGKQAHFAEEAEPLGEDSETESTEAPQACAADGTATTVSMAHVRNLTCLEVDHVRSVTDSLTESRRVAHFDDDFEERCREAFRQADIDGSGLLEISRESQQVADAVNSVLSQDFLERLQVSKAEYCAMAFDGNRDRCLSEDEFVEFARWATAMKARGFLTGQKPFEIVSCGMGDRLMVISEYLDEDASLRECLRPDVDMAVYHPNGITSGEFAAQIRAAASKRQDAGLPPYKTVALSNHGPDESGVWGAFAGPPCDLSKTAECAELVPAFAALAGLLAAGSSEGRLDLLSCNLGSVSGGLDLIKSLEAQLGGARVCASTDETGNVACGGNWVLEVGDVNVAPDYFDESQLESFTKLMAGKAPGRRAGATAPTARGSKQQNPKLGRRVPKVYRTTRGKRLINSNKYAIGSGCDTDSEDMSEDGLDSNGKEKPEVIVIRKPYAA